MIFSIPMLVSADQSVRTINFGEKLFSLDFKFKMNLPVLIINECNNNQHEATDDLDHVIDKFIFENKTCLVVHVLTYIDDFYIYSHIDYQYYDGICGGESDKHDAINRISCFLSSNFELIENHRIAVWDAVAVLIFNFEETYIFSLENEIK